MYTQNQMPDNQTILHSQSLNRKIIFSFGSILRWNNFILKHKISEQQINPKVLSVASSCHYNGNSKKWQKSFIDKCSILESYPNKSPSSGQKLRCKSPRVGANFSCKSQGVCGGMVMDEINTCINYI